jgi:hypothetical protein
VLYAVHMLRVVLGGLIGWSRGLGLCYARALS